MVDHGIYGPRSGLVYDHFVVHFLRVGFDCSADDLLRPGQNPETMGVQVLTGPGEVRARKVPWCITFCDSYWSETWLVS